MTSRLPTAPLLLAGGLALASSVAVPASPAAMPAPAAAPATASAAKPLSTSLGLVVFPTKPQSPSRQAADEGAIIGEVADNDAGKGAAIGATARGYTVR